MSSKAYTGTPNLVNPAAGQNTLNQAINTNPIGSEVAALYGKDTTLHIKRDIYEQIVQNTPAQFSALRLLMSRPTIYKGDREFTWVEKSWSRPSLVAGSGSNSTTLVLTAGQGALVSVNDEVVYPDNSHAIVTAISGDSLTVAAATGGATLPSATAGDLIVVQSTVKADGQNWDSHFDRIQTVEHVGYMSRGGRAKRWTREQIAKYQNLGTTDFYEVDMMDKMEQAYADMFSIFFNGKKGKYSVTTPKDTVLTGGTYESLTSYGIYPLLVDSGAQHATSNPVTLASDFERLSFNTNYKAPNEPRFIFGTDKMLYALSKSFKNPIRYAPSDKIADMNLTQYDLGTQKFVPVVTELFKSSSYLFPAFFENLLLVVDINTINPVCMKGFEPVEMWDSSKLARVNGGNQDWIDWAVDYMVGLQMTNTDGAFYIQGTGF